MIWPSRSRLIEVLERELEVWKGHYLHERQRAELLADQLLELRVPGASGVTRPLIDEQAEVRQVKAQEQIERMWANPEFARAGDADG